MIPWARGRCMAWDTTSPDTLARSHVMQTSCAARAAARAAERTKIAKYADLPAFYSFIPLAFETLGSWAAECAAFVRDPVEGFHLRLGTAGSTRFFASGSASPSSVATP